MPTDQDTRGLAVPAGRLQRMAKFGGLAASVAGNLAVAGGKELARGRRPELRDLLLTPANATRLTRQLAEMRGAAMKMGQLLSMEASDLLPPELTEILSALRADAYRMPARQLKEVLTAEWGPDFLRQFQRFDVNPIAAASIGQVHRAQAKDGRDLAIKVQYPGVRQSIDSDVRNVGALMRVSGVLPKEIDMAPLLEEARRQLHEEADYEREARYLAAFRDRLAGHASVLLPQPAPDLTTKSILAMTFVAGRPLEALDTEPQDVRDAVMTVLFDLLARELFEFRLMQTDPNFANYLWDGERIVLLDFGATREISETLADGVKSLLKAGLDGDRAEVEAALRTLGLLTPTVAPRLVRQMLDLFEVGFAAIQGAGPFDFGDRALIHTLRDDGMALGTDREFWVIPPVDLLFIQRKVAGFFLLATRLRARVDLGAILDRYLR